MHEADFVEAVRHIATKDPRYEVEAYLFVREVLDFAVKALKKPPEGPERHVTARELLGCIRTYGLREFGPMAFTVFNTWGVKRTDDFGEVVFNLVDAGILGKTEEDSKEDFAGVYDFVEAFEKPFLPQSTQHGTGRTRSPRGGTSLPQDDRPSTSA